MPVCLITYNNLNHEYNRSYFLYDMRKLSCEYGLELETFGGNFSLLQRHLLKFTFKFPGLVKSSKLTSCAILTG